MDIPPPAALRKIVREVHGMVNDPPEGIRMILGEDMSDIQAWIQGPGQHWLHRQQENSVPWRKPFSNLRLTACCQ
jgi:hypothetical protein